MELFKNQIEDVVVVAIDGQLDGSTANETLSYFESQYEGSNKQFIADFNKLDYISSAGLRVLLSVLKDLRRMNGDLRLVGVKADVQKVLSATGFTRMFKIYDDLDTGVASFSE